METRGPAPGEPRKIAATWRFVGTDLDAGYLRAIAMVEDRPENQSGADKSWVREAEAAFRRHYALASRVTRGPIHGPAR